MKVPTRRLRKAAAKRPRAPGGSSGERSAPVPKRQVVLVPPLSARKPPSVQEVDLTADTPPEEMAVVRGAEGVRLSAGSTSAAERDPGEGPSGEGPSGEGPPGERSPPPEELVDSPAQPTPRSDVAAEERAEPPLQRSSFFDDVRRAERLLTQAIPLESREELKHLGARVFYREALTALLRAAASLVVTRDIINGGEAAICQVQLSAEEAHARAEAAEKALEAARSDGAAAVKEAEGRAASEAIRLRAALDQLGMAESAVEARNIRIAELESAVQEAGARVALAEEREKEAEAKAARFEEKEKEAEAKAARLEEKEKEALSLAAEKEVRAEEAEARAREAEAAAEARVSRAVEEYKASEHFMEEMTEASTEAFAQGFDCGKKKVARVLNIPQALEIEMDRASEVSSSDDEPAAADP